MEFNSELLPSAGMGDMLSALPEDAQSLFRGSLGSVLGQNELRDLENAFKQFGGDESNSTAICGCESGCSCNNCQCMGKTGYDSQIDDLLDNAVSSLGSLDNADLPIQSLQTDLTDALMKAFGNSFSTDA